MNLPVELLEKAEAEFPHAPDKVAALRARINTSRAVELDGIEHYDRRREMIAATALEDVGDAFERYIGTNQLLPINYLAIGTQRARAVGRIAYFDKTVNRRAMATGFMVTPELMLTNHHVFSGADGAEFAQRYEDATIEFGYEFGLDGRRGESLVFDLDPQAFFHSEISLDLAVVAVKPTDRSGRARLAGQGFLVLNGRLGKAGVGDFATVIQHPNGEEKQVALRSNEVIDNTLDDFLIYKTDTATGSSGAPVFNNEWQVIALHSAGVAKKNNAGQYLDKDDQVIEVVNGRVDEKRVVWLSNRGVRVSAIVAHLKAAANGVNLHPLVQPLFSPAYTDSRPFNPMPAVAVEPAAGVESLALPSATAPSPVPRAMPAAAAPISIQINIGADGRALVSTGSVAGARLESPAVPVLDFEKKYEDEMDFSRCEGFQDEFMGVRVPMPVPGAKLRKMLAPRTDRDKAYILQYHHFSTLHHAVRRVPVVSAINVHGKYRYAALTGRSDKWYRDNRIDYDCQLDDGWYYKSGFDKGHLARREDAEWGSTEAFAKLAADMTCSYANAIPQVPGLNRAKYGAHGKWGQLEEKLLESGVANESGKAGRICVFAGPLFGDEDPPYAGVQVALECYKIVVWYDGTGTLRTTCFTLSQAGLVDGIAFDFEALHFDQIFKASQCSLASLEARSGLKFDAVMHGCDTWNGDEAPVDDASLERLVKRFTPKRARAGAVRQTGA